MAHRGAVPAPPKTPIATDIPTREVNFDFSINAWAAHAPGLASPALWQAWARRPFLPVGHEQPALGEMPAMMRRRLGPLGRTAAQTAYLAHGDRLGLPVVFGSRYGDASRSLDLLADLARHEPISPTAFGLSVHNAIGAMYSIARGDRANYVAVAAGRANAQACLVEAAGLLADGASEVLVVCYEEALPGAYVEFQDEPSALYGWAWRVGRTAPGQARYRLSNEAASRKDAPCSVQLPMALDVLRFYLAGDSSLRQTADGTTWIWSRHAD